MKLEKKLIACSIIAIIVGVSSVVPLVFLMATPAKADTLNEPWFSITMPYGYYVTSDGPLTNIPWEAPWESELNETNSVSEQHTIFLNITQSVDTTELPVDAQFEYLQIDVSSDKELIETMRFVVGTYLTNDFNVSEVFQGFMFTRNEWFDTSDFNLMKYGGGGGLSGCSWICLSSSRC